LVAVVGMTLLCTTGVWAQDRQSEFDPWGEATVAAAFEHDLAKAAKIYRDIAGSPQETAEMQTKALLELGKVLRKAGMVAEAKAALKQASEGTGNAAKKATKLLTAGNQDPDLLQVKVEKLIAHLRKVPLSFHDLLWIGEPAAPYVVSAVDKEKADLEFIAGASRVLLRMGGKAAEEWAKKAPNYSDVLKRRAVVKGFGGIYPASMLKVSPQTVQGFLKDKEASVRRDAVGQLVFHVPADRIIAMLKDPSADVQLAARTSIQSRWSQMKHGERWDENLAQVIGVFHDSGWQLSGQLPGQYFTGSQKGRLLFLRSLRLGVVKNHTLWVHAKATAPTEEEIKEIMTTVSALGPAVGAKSPGSRARSSLARFVRQTSEAWDHAATPIVLKLVALNYGPVFHIDTEKWLIKHAKVSDIPAIAGELRWMRRPDELLHWMAKQPVPGTALKNLQAFAQWLDGIDWGARKSRPFSGQVARQSRYAACEAIAAMRTSDAEKHLVSLIRREPGTNQNDTQKEAWSEWKDSAFHALKKNGDDQTMRTLAELLVIPGDSKHAHHVRYGALETLAILQAQVAVGRYAKAYQMGFESPGNRRRTTVTVDGQKLRVYGGLRQIVESRGAAPDVRNGREPYTDETLARIFDSCLATGKLVAFQDATYCVTQMRLPYAAVKAIANRALQCPNKKPDSQRGNPMALRQLLVRRLVDKYPTAPGIVQLIQKSLRDRDPRIRRLVIGEIRPDHVKDTVVLELLEKCLRDENEAIVILASNRLAGTHFESLVAEQNYLLAYKSAYVQSDVAMALLKAKGADAIPTVGKLLLPGTSLYHGHRQTLLRKMAEFRDMRAVPFLLEALKDENDGVRKTAEAELKSIRFYNEQKQLWARLMNGTDLNAASAAEALVKQATDGKKDVRLTAIQSLGTLGKVETLPFLIKLMGDEDPDIRKAAKAAADRINTAKAKDGDRK